MAKERLVKKPEVVPKHIPTASELEERWADRNFQRQQHSRMLSSYMGSAIKSVRLQRGITIEELSAITDIPAPAIFDIERGEAPGAGLSTIAAILWGLDARISCKFSDGIPRYSILDKGANGDDT